MCLLVVGSYHFWTTSYRPMPLLDNSILPYLQFLSKLQNVYTVLETFYFVRTMSDASQFDLVANSSDDEKEIMERNWKKNISEIETVLLFLLC